MRLKEKCRQRRCGTHCQPCVARMDAPGLAMLPVSSAIEIPKFGEAADNRAQVTEEPLDRLGASSGFVDVRG